AARSQPRSAIGKRRGGSPGKVGGRTRALGIGTGVRRRASPTCECRTVVSAWIDIVAIAVPLLAAGLLGAGLRGPLPHAALPLLLAGLPRSAKARWRSFERDLWAYIAAHNPGRGSSSDDD